MDLNQVTIQDCIDMKEYKNKAVILIAGKVVGFEREEE